MNATRVLSIPADVRDRVKTRFDRYADSPDQSGCMTWQASKDRYGYGRFSVKRGTHEIATTAHRIAWLLARGPITDPELVLDHICRNRACVNVEHLRLATVAENTGWGMVPVANRSKFGLPDRRPRQSQNGDTCPHGHPWVEGNIYTRLRGDGYISRTCKTCTRERQRAHKAKQEPAVIRVPNRDR